MPLSYQGSIIRGIELRFQDGLVIESKATENEALLKQMIAQTDANKVGEFSLTDSRLSRITRFMGETLYDENV
jgi:aminopeptidase